jgi:hypothetical protein
MNKTKLLIVFLVILLIISIGASLILYQKSLIPKTGDTKPEIQELSLIDNEYTKNLNKLPEGWKPYKNDEYGFQINYPESFEGQKVEIGQAEFSNWQELYNQNQEGKVPDDTQWLYGNDTNDKKIIDFNFSKENAKISLFAATIYPNKSNLSLKDFVSQEILNNPEGIDDQRIVSINGIYGYRLVLTRATNSSPLVVIYYFPAEENKNIISISTPIEIFKGGYGPNFEFESFIKAYPKYNGELQNMENILTIGGDQETFDRKYPEYKSFVQTLSEQSAQKELEQRTTFEKIVSSFRF